MTSNYIYLSILVATVATYSCRAFGVFSSRNLSTESPIFHWIKVCFNWNYFSSDYQDNPISLGGTFN